MSRYKRNDYCTIYILKNTENTKVYIGQTWKDPSQRMKTGYANCCHMSSAIKKYGKDKFYYETLRMAYTQEDADALEIFFIAQYNSIDREIGYNIEKGGNSAGKTSEETLAKMRKRRHSKATLKKMSVSHIGQVPVNKGKPSPFKGIKRDPQIGNKISKSKIKYAHLEKPIAIDYISGLNSWQLGTKYNISQTTVLRLLRNQNVKLRRTRKK
jgi:group I intron endonuclease